MYAAQISPQISAATAENNRLQTETILTETGGTV